MDDRTKQGLKALLDVKRFLPSPQDILRPFPPPKRGGLIAQGVVADLLDYAFGYIPGVGDVIGNFVNDNIMADVLQKMTEVERNEFRQQNRVYPNGVALLRTFQRAQLSPGSRS